MHELFTAMETEFHQICQENTNRIQSLEDEVRSLIRKIKTLEKNQMKANHIVDETQ